MKNVLIIVLTLWATLATALFLYYQDENRILTIAIEEHVCEQSCEGCCDTEKVVKNLFSPKKIVPQVEPGMLPPDYISGPEGTGFFLWPEGALFGYFIDN